MSMLTPPSLFRASAMHADGDPWAANGYHIRVNASPTLGFPIHPFVAVPLLDFPQRDPSELPELRVIWYDESGQPAPAAPFDLNATGPLRSQIIGRGQQAMTPDWCFLFVDSNDAQARAELLDRRQMPFGQTVLAARSGRPYSFAGSHLAQLRLSGSGMVNGLRGLHEEDVLTDHFGQAEVFGLPLEPSRWYAPFTGQDGLSMAKDRLHLGQGQRLRPGDLPAGSFPAAAQDDDIANLFEHLAPKHIDPWLQAAYFADDPNDFPSTVTRTFTGALGTQQGKTVLPAWNMLLSMTADPRIARYLGFYTVLREAEFAVERRPSGWLVAGEFAIPRIVRRSLRRAGITLAARNDNHWLPSFLHSRFQMLFPDAAQVRQAVEEDGPIPTLGWDVVTVFTIAAAVTSVPPNPPTPPHLELAAPGRWNSGDGGAHWAQSIALLDQPPSGTLGFARMDPAGLTPLHQYVPENDPAQGRATALIAQWSEEPPAVAGTFYPQVLAGKNGVLWSPPILSDIAIPTAGGGASWQIWQSDAFGRWSEPAQIAAPLPARPLPPPPVPELDFRPQEAAGSAPASPGTVNARISVPSLAQLGPGAQPLQKLEISVNGGQPESIALNGVSELVVPFAAPDTLPGGKTLVQVVAVFENSDGARSPTTGNNGKAERWIFDPRPVEVNKTAPTILWTGRLDATGKAELALQWNAPAPAARYRVYLGDQRRLADALGVGGADLVTRADWANAIFEKAKNGALNDKKMFTLLTETPLQPGPGSVVTFKQRIPGGLRGVQLMRIVPVTEAGAEAAFATCGLTPIAVPFEEQPPAPTVRVTQAPGGVKVQVLAYGLTKALLDAHNASAHPPQFRVRRARERVGESIYLTSVKEGPLSPPEAGAGVGAPWTAEFVDETPLPLYVSYSWLAEVRYPDEPARVPGADDIVSPLQVRSMFPGRTPDAPSAWSALSLPAPLMLIEMNGPQAAPQASAVRQADGSVKLLVENVPVIHPKAVEAYQVALWTWVQDGDGEKLRLPPDGSPPEQTAVTRLPVPRGAASITYDDLTPSVTGYSVSLVDPIGRQGAVSRIMVTDNA